MNWSTQWRSLVETHTPIVGLELSRSDRIEVWAAVYAWAQPRSLPVYLWNPADERLHEVQMQFGQMRLFSTSRSIGSDIFAALLADPQPGIFLIEGSLGDELTLRQTYQILDAYNQIRWSNVQQHWILLERYIQLPIDLQPFVPVITVPLPSPAMLEERVQHFCQQHSHLLKTAVPAAQATLVRACQGLPMGELDVVLERFATPAKHLLDLSDRLLHYKISKLQGRGIEYFAEPDVPAAGGFEQLDAHLDRVAALLDPAAARYGLRVPRGMILWGPPGTGKSLSAKLAAKKLGVPLLAVDWGAILGAKQPDLALRELLDLAVAMAPIVLFWDDFEKGFSGWDSNQDGGVARRLSGKLLIWMQEQKAAIFIVATVNRLAMLPPELTRRFDDVFFCDLPHAGGRYEIFNLHLAKYFPAFRSPHTIPWSDEQWRVLLRDYSLCTPAEIAVAIERAANEVYFQHYQRQEQPEELTLGWQLLHAQLRSFTPAMEREEGQMIEIRNNAALARPAAGADRSRFAVPEQELFGE